MKEENHLFNLNCFDMTRRKAENVCQIDAPLRAEEEEKKR